MSDSTDPTIGSIGPWWVIHTKSRCEKKMDSWFETHQFDHYLPVRAIAREYTRKKVIFQHPLFSGYAFGAFHSYQRAQVFASGYAARIMEVTNQNGLLEELNAIKLALAAGFELESCPYFTIGSKVRITTGAMKNVKGRLEGTGTKSRFIISVEFLQKSVAMEVDPMMLEMIAE